jgi:hypothetical protein
MGELRWRFPYIGTRYSRETCSQAAGMMGVGPQNFVTTSTGGKVFFPGTFQHIHSEW